MPAFAERLARTKTAATVAMTARARALREQGIDVIQLTIGEPDFATPPHAIAAAHEAALAGDTKYPPQDGTRRLKQAVQRMFEREHRLSFGPEQVVVGNGGKQVIFDALLATVEEGDEVLIPAPYWSAYALMARVCGATPSFVDCLQGNGFRLDADDLDAAITPATRWVFLNSPNNPTGAALSRDELVLIGDVLRRHPHVWVLADDLYSHLRYDNQRPVTLAEVAPGLRDRVLTVNGVSKAYAMTGWRIGFGAGPADLVAAMANMQGQATAGVSTVGQAAAVAALDGPQEQVAASVASYRERRDLVVDALGGIAGISCHRPEGAFYVYPSVAGCLGRRSAGGRRIDSDEDFALALLDEQHVAVVHGGSFGMSPYLRISYAADRAVLLRACQRIAAFVAGLS